MLESVFCEHRPRQDCCCLCGATFGEPSRDLYYEQRPTGPDFTLQAWPYCPSCWTACQAPDDPENALRYRLFLQYLAGRYNRRRSDGGLICIDPHGWRRSGRLGRN